MDRIKLLNHVARLQIKLDALSYDVDDRNPARYSDEYQEKHADTLKATYSPEEVQNIITDLINLAEGVGMAVDMTIDERMEYIGMRSVDDGHLIET